jgi:hypothetical protein
LLVVGRGCPRLWQQQAAELTAVARGCPRLPAVFSGCLRLPAFGGDGNSRQRRCPHRYICMRKASPCGYSYPPKPDYPNKYMNMFKYMVAAFRWIKACFR